MTLERIPPADPSRVRKEGEPAEVISLDGWHRNDPRQAALDRQNARRDALIQKALAKQGKVSPPPEPPTNPGLVAIPEKTLHDIIDKQDRVVTWLLELKEHCDDNSECLLGLTRLVKQLAKDLNAETARNALLNRLYLELRTKLEAPGN